jgi:putative transcriptional regulator
MSKLNINGLLKQYGLAQKDLVECTGINKNTVSKYCNNTFENINKTHIDLLCKFFNCTPNDLFTIDETVEVKTPTIVLYDNDTNYFEIINDGVKEVKRKINDPNYTIRKDGMILPESSLIQEIHEDKEPYIAIPSLEQQEYIKQRIDEQLKNKISEIKKELKEEYKNYIKALIDKSIDSHIESAKDDYKKAINLNAKKHLSNTETIQDFYKNHNISEKSNFESNKFAHEIKLTASNNFDKNDFINDESPKLELKVKNNKRYINKG